MTDKATSMAPQTAPGLPCPSCGARIVIDVRELLLRDSFACPACGLTLDLDRKRSEGALRAAEKVVVAMQEIDDLKKRWR